MTRMRAGTMSYRLCHIADASNSICAARARRLFVYPCNACFRYVYRIRIRGNIELKTSRYTSRPLTVLDARIRKIASVHRRQLGLALPQSCLRTLMHPSTATPSQYPPCQIPLYVRSPSQNQRCAYYLGFTHLATPGRYRPCHFSPSQPSLPTTRCSLSFSQIA